MRRSRPLAIGVIGLLVLLAAAIVWWIPGIEDDLAARAEDELAAADIDGVTVSFDGRNGRLSGAEAEAAEQNLGTLRGARWVRAEPTIPTTTTTIPTTTTTTIPELAAVTVSREGSTVRLEGTVQSEQDRLALTDQVTAAGFDVEDALIVDSERDGSGTIGLVPLITPILDGSDDGELALADGTVVLTGTAYDPVEAEEIDAAIELAVEAGLDVSNMVNTRVLSEAQQIDALQDEIDQIFELARAIDGQNPSFEISDDELSTPATDILDRVTVAMRRYPLPWADIVGHTDAQGSAASNQILSETRAGSVRDYLVGGGIDDARLAVSGLGESQPIADNATDEGRAENRRVDFVIKKSGG